MKGIGIIGCGGRLRSLIGSLPGLGKKLRITALCDNSPRAIAAARALAGPAAKVYSDYRALVRDPAVDWVFVGSWNCYHRAHAVAALNAGKHVFCEKPLATTLADCLAMRRAYERAGTRFCVGFTLRYRRDYRKLKALIDSGAIGDIVSMEFNETLHFGHGGFIHGDWRRFRKYAGSHLLEKCCHDIDLVHWISGSLPRRVASFGGCDFFVPKNAHYMRDIGKPPAGQQPFCLWPRAKDANPFTARKDIVDNQVAILEFQNGFRATFHTNCSTNIGERRMYICGTEGTIRFWGHKIELRRIGYNQPVQTFELPGEVGGHGGSDTVMLRELSRAILNDEPMPTTLEDGLRAVVTCLGIDRAMDTGRVVDLRPVWKRVGRDG